MIIEEFLESGLVYHYSDSGMKIRQQPTGIIYDNTVDVVPCQYTYVETDIPLDPVDGDAEAEEILSILLGEEAI